MMFAYEPGDTTLINAAFYGHVECMRHWMQTGADMNLANYNGETPLMHAVKMGQDQCTEILIEAGADVNIADSRGNTALLNTSRRGEAILVAALIQAGADVNVTRRDGKTPLMDAVRSGDYNCVVLLLKAGTVINKVDMNGYPALTHSLIKRRPKFGMLLYAAGENGYVPYDSDIILDLFQLKDIRYELKHLCKQKIRQHLLNLDPHSHLFYRIPKLGLPSSITRYLLFYVSLDD